MKKVLVIGGSGFLGGYLVGELNNPEITLFAVINKNPVAGIDSARQISGGIRQVTSEFIDDLRPDIIFHLARPVMPVLRKWGRRFAAHYAAWLNSNLLKNLQRSSSKPLLVFASGSLMYGNSAETHLEDSPLNPISFARQYYKGELPIVAAAEKKTYPVQVFRLPWLLGYGSWFKWFYLNNIQKSKSIPKFGDGQNLMEIIDVNDAVKLMVKIAFENGNHGIINIPSAGVITQQQFLEQIARVFDARIVDYSGLYPGKVEKAITEAYTSNIVLGTRQPELFRGFNYTDILESLKLLKGKQTSTFDN